MPHVFVVNVFANASHAFVNPLFDESTFEVIPIPEGKRYRGEWIGRYSVLKCFNSHGSLTRFLPKRDQKRYVHNDPDLVNMTYGDVFNPRSGLLEQVKKNDWVAFYALLTPIQNQRPVKRERGFYFVAAFEVKDIIRELPDINGRAETRRKIILRKYGPSFGRRLLENAHTRRWLKSPHLNDTMTMIIVGRKRSKRFHRPLLLDRSFCVRYFRDKNSKLWNWDKSKSDLQTIGSYLRSIRTARRPENLIKLFTTQCRINAPILYSYTVAHDSGFAPCVTTNLLSLACCKPKIRSVARPGDWVMGTTPKNRAAGKLIFLTKIDEKITFADYYRRYRKHGRADVIYKPTVGNSYKQLKNPHHGPKNKARDLSIDAVLLCHNFVYYGRSAVILPEKFTPLVAITQGHKMLEENGLVAPLLDWARNNLRRIQGPPTDTVAC